MTFLSIFLIRLFELFYIKSTSFVVIETKAVLSGINLDGFFLGSLNITLFMPLLFLSAFLPRFCIFLLRVANSLAVLITLTLTHFFLTNNYLLSDEILFFSLLEIISIISSEISMNRLYLWSLYLLLPIMLTQFLILRKITVSGKFTRAIILGFVVLSIIILINTRHYKKDLCHFANRYNYYLGNNKTLYLAHCIYEYSKSEIPNSSDELMKDVQTFHSLNKLRYFSKEYPLLREDETENVLGPYFKTADRMPNIVIIISEGLSSSFCGKYADLMNLTPFLDSLMKQALYWRNFLSNTDRSYGALPNILASLPYGGRRGFVSLYDDRPGYPRHNSLIKILKNNGYYTTFHYGGWANFDHMADFLYHNGIDKILSDYTFDKSRYDLSNGRKDEFFWGYDDKDLFRHVLENMDSIPLNKPQLNIITTISLHSPYNMCDKHYYNTGYINKRLKMLNLGIKDVISKFKQVPASQIESYGLGKKFESDLAFNLLTTIFFIDDAMKEFFYNYRKRPDYQNTIFIITGDHNIGTLPLKNEIDNNRVPLIIFSPLLKQHKEFSAVSAHIDILPSLLGLLNKDYGLHIPSKYHWMGKGLDTSGIYRNRNIYSLSLYSKNSANFFCKDYLVSSDRVFHVKKNLETEDLRDTLIRDSILKIMKNYTVINNYACYQDKITE